MSIKLNITIYRIFGIYKPLPIQLKCQRWWKKKTNLEKYVQGLIGILRSAINFEINE